MIATSKHSVSTRLKGSRSNHSLSRNTNADKHIKPDSFCEDRSSVWREQKPKKASYVNKKSEVLSQNLVKKQIQTTVEYLSQNGYISFANFLQVLNLLQITKCLGRVNPPIEKSSQRAQFHRENIERKEFIFATNLWNIINRYLFNYVDSIIWIDFLTILLSKDPLENVDLAEEYLHDVSYIEDMPEHEVRKNREMNENIYVKRPWSIQQLFKQYLENFKQPIQITRQIKGPIGQTKLIETLNDHFKDYTFKPKISSKSKQIERKRREEAEQQIQDLRQSFNWEDPSPLHELGIPFVKYF